MPDEPIFYPNARLAELARRCSPPAGWVDNEVQLEPPLNPDGTPEEVVVRTIDDCTPDELRDLVTATLRLLRKPDAVVEGNS